MKSLNFRLRLEDPRKLAEIYENSNAHYIVTKRRCTPTIFLDLRNLRKSSEDVQLMFDTLKYHLILKPVTLYFLDNTPLENAPTLFRMLMLALNLPSNSSTMFTFLFRHATCKGVSPSLKRKESHQTVLIQCLKDF